MIKENKKEIFKRIIKLKEQINKYRYYYHVLNQDIISSEVLDSLKKELFDLENKYPEFITPDSPTQRLPKGLLKGFKKVKHFSRMLSFNDAFSEDDMYEWLKRIENYLGYKIKQEFYCELKIDGLAIELVYEKGILKTGSTRGDGFIGEDVTVNLKTIEAIPLSIEKKINFQIPDLFVVTGEVFFNKKEFERINQEQKEKGEKIFSNPRNMAAGTLRQLNPKIVLERNLDSFQYDIVTDLDFKTHEKKHQVLKKLGFKVNPFNKLVFSLKEIFEFKNYWEKNRNMLPYEIDGIVVIINNNELFNRLGIVGKASRGAIAFKFSPKEATTIVEDIIVQIGRTGILTPVAILKPVNIGGVMISRATLHNMDEIKKLDLKIKDTVVVARSGDVIPKIIRVLKELRTGQEKEFFMPKYCPIDKALIVKDGVFYRCSNRKCGARYRNQIFHFIKVLGIKGLGKKIIERFLNENLINEIYDLFLLKEDNLKTLFRFGEKSAKNIITEINKKKIIKLDKFIYALGINQVGEQTARLLLDLIKTNKKELTVLEFYNLIRQIKIDEYLTIKDIGLKTAQNIYNWFNDKSNIFLLKQFDSIGLKLILEDIKYDKKLSNLVFVLTGTLKSFTREQARLEIEKRGGKVVNYISKKINFLILGENAGLKYLKAKKLNIKILNENEFLKLLKN